MHQIPVTGWVAIGVFVLSTVFTVIWFYYKKRMTRIEALESAVFGNTGLGEKLHKYVTHEVLERRLSEFTVSMKGISEEGTRREERILEAISSQTLVLSAQISEVKTDVRQQSLRIDQVIQSNNNR